MPQLAATQIADLVATTIANFKRASITELATDVQEHVGFNKLFKEENVQIGSGTTIKRLLMLNHSGAARNVGMFENDSVNVKDVVGTVEIDWRHSTTNYAFDIREEALNSGAEQLVDLVKLRRMDAMISMAALVESNFWTQGPATSTDKITPMGLQYWCVKPAAGGTVDGFSGSYPSGHTGGCGGLIDARWANYQANYAAVTKADLITKMRKVYVKTGFKSPIGTNPIGSNARGSDRYGLYTNYATVAALEALGEDQNENLGRDIASMDGKITFRGIPVTWVPYLDSDTSNPIFLVNWAVLFPVTYKGFNMRETKPKEAPMQHNVIVSHVDLTWNLMCVDRRRLGVLSV